MYYINMKVKVNVPTSLRDIKLSQYQKFVRTTEGSEDEQFIARQLVGIYCNLPDEVVGKIAIRDFESIVGTIADFFTKEEHEHQPIIEHNGKRYGFIPNLDLITVGEQADIESNINDWDKMHLVMGVLYRPITSEKKGKYLIEEYEKNNPLDLTMDVVFGAMVFFYNLTKDLLNYIQSTTIQEVVQSPKIKETLEKNGVGIKTFMLSLEETFSTLTELANYHYTKHYYSSHLKQIKTG